MKHKSLNILMIEDDAIEVMKLHRTITSLNKSHAIVEMKNGDQALAYLNSQAPFPDIILLDLNMPKLDGIEFLAILKADSKLASIPTIVLTTSNNPKDVLSCYKLGIAGYVFKPLSYEDYKLKIEQVLSYWSLNELTNR
jgi:CheY-like chemotaxis protein